MTSTSSLLATFRIVVPSYASLADDTVETWLASTVQRLATSGWGNVYAEAVSYLTAHRLFLAGYRSDGTCHVEEVDAKADAAGPAVSKGAGNVSEGYTAAPRSTKISAADGHLMQTTFGREFIQLRDSRAGARMLLVDVNG